MPSELPAFAKPRIGLKGVDQRHEVIDTDNPFELQTGTFVPNPDHIGLNPANFGQTNQDPVATRKAGSTINHETIGRDIDDVQRHVTVHAVFRDYREIDGMTRCLAHVRDA